MVPVHWVCVDYCMCLCVLQSYTGDRESMSCSPSTELLPGEGSSNAHAGYAQNVTIWLHARRFLMPTNPSGSPTI